MGGLGAGTCGDMRGADDTHSRKVTTPAARVCREARAGFAARRRYAGHICSILVCRAEMLGMPAVLEGRARHKARAVLTARGGRLR